MRPSKLNTTLAVLRCETGTTAAAFASILGIKVQYLRDLESGRHHKLGESLGKRAAEETNCCPKWLLRGCPDRKCVSKNGKPFTQLGFEAYRAMRAAGLGVDVTSLNLRGCIRELAAIAEAASAKNLLPAFQARYGRLIHDLRETFGFSGDGFKRACEFSFPEYWISQGPNSNFDEARYSLPSSTSQSGRLEADGKQIGQYPRESTGPIDVGHGKARISQVHPPQSSKNEKRTLNEKTG